MLVYALVPVAESVVTVLVVFGRYFVACHPCCSWCCSRPSTHHPVPQRTLTQFPARRTMYEPPPGLAVQLLDDRLPHVWAGANVQDAAIPWPSW